MASKRHSTSSVPSVLRSQSARLDAGDTSSPDVSPQMNRRHSTGETCPQPLATKYFIPADILAGCFLEEEAADELANVNTSNMDPAQAAKIKAQRKQKKMNREKLKRSKLNLLFDHLCGVLAMGSSTRVEKLAVLNETIREVTELREENERLRQQKGIIRQELDRRRSTGMHPGTRHTPGASATGAIPPNNTPVSTPAQNTRDLATQPSSAMVDENVTMTHAPNFAPPLIWSSTDSNPGTLLEPVRPTHTQSCPPPALTHTRSAPNAHGAPVPSLPRSQTPPARSPDPTPAASPMHSVRAIQPCSPTTSTGLYSLSLSDPIINPDAAATTSSSSSSSRGRPRRLSRHQRMETFEELSLEETEYACKRSKRFASVESAFDDDDLLGGRDNMQDLASPTVKEIHTHVLKKEPHTMLADNGGGSVSHFFRRDSTQSTNSDLDFAFGPSTSDLSFSMNNEALSTALNNHLLSPSNRLLSPSTAAGPGSWLPVLESSASKNTLMAPATPSHKRLSSRNAFTEEDTARTELPEELRREFEELYHSNDDQFFVDSCLHNTASTPSGRRTSVTEMDGVDMFLNDTMGSMTETKDRFDDHPFFN